VASQRVLMALTSCAVIPGTGRPTGAWSSELLEPYHALRRAGCTVDFATPAGTPPPFDPISLDAGSARALAEPGMAASLERTSPLTEVGHDYDAYFVVGGYGVMWDLHTDQRLHQLLAVAWDEGKIIGGVCHGPSALAGVLLPGGGSLVEGRRVTAFSNDEDVATGMAAVLPCSPEDELRKAGARYEKADQLFGVHVAVDGRLVTGQNPPSASAVGLALAQMLTS
jgi:putative intracellular protease/amidase